MTRKAGAILDGGSCVFTVWAPDKKSVELKILSMSPAVYKMIKDIEGYWSVKVDNIKAGALYMYSVDGGDFRPDPVSFSQPKGVHGPSCVVDHFAFKWTDGNWKGINPAGMIIYEMHAGTFTGEGTFEAAVKKIPHLKKTGLNAVEIMPVAQFPGGRNWGYDGTYIYAAQNSYGGHSGLKKFVNECHKSGLAVILDVVYNHLGPEGNYAGVYARYFTDRYKTPWGDAVDFDGENSRPVRDFYINNVLYWMKEFHVDVLRLDAVHAIFDNSDKHILAEMQEQVDAFSAADGRQRYLIAESDLNDSRIVRLPEKKGFGFAAQWEDDFHHCLHVSLTGEKQGYYSDFITEGLLERTLARCYIYEGDFSKARQKNHGNSVDGLDSSKFVVFSQNHDQIGNRMLGERLITLAGFEAAKLAAGFYLLSPYIPMIFMGEEYGEENPFLYFVNHSDEGLIEAVRQGRKKEFVEFSWKGEPPDPQDEGTLKKSTLSWDISGEKRRAMAAFYRELIKIRKQYIRHREVMERPAKAGLRSFVSFAGEGTVLMWNFSEEEKDVLTPEGGWKKVIDSACSKWAGPGGKTPSKAEAGQEIKLMPHSFAVYKRG